MSIPEARYRKLIMMRRIINQDRKISIDALKVIVYDGNSWNNIFYDTFKRSWIINNKKKKRWDRHTSHYLDVLYSSDERMTMTSTRSVLFFFSFLYRSLSSITCGLWQLRTIDPIPSSPPTARSLFLYSVVYFHVIASITRFTNRKDRRWSYMSIIIHQDKYRTTHTKIQEPKNFFPNNMYIIIETYVSSYKKQTMFICT